MREGVIIAALRSGNVRRAAELLLEAYQDEVYGYCARLVGPSEAPKVYYRVVRVAMGELPARGTSLSLRAWLYGIARDAVSRHRRRRRRERELKRERDRRAAAAERETPDEASGGVDAAAQQAPEPTDPSGRNDLLGWDHELDDALARLDPNAREVLQLALWDDLRLNEIARITGRGSAEVRSVVAQGLVELAGLTLRREGLPS